MPEADRNAALLGSLRSLVRGLSALFWGLPAALVVAAQTGKGDWKILGVAPIICVTLLLLYGVILLGKFQPQERIWTTALERARLVAIINVGLAPFLFFWSKMPGNTFFAIMVEVMFLTMLAFLFLLNAVLARLAAMLPDETLRSETKLFTRLNQTILLVVIPTQPIYFLLHNSSKLPRFIVEVMLRFEGGGPLLQLMLMMFFILLPVAMTMALLWKTKETIMAGVFANLNSPEPPTRAE